MGGIDVPEADFEAQRCRDRKLGRCRNVPYISPAVHHFDEMTTDLHSVSMAARGGVVEGREWKWNLNPDLCEVKCS